jgi:hypothetical protein
MIWWRQVVGRPKGPVATAHVLEADGGVEIVCEVAIRPWHIFPWVFMLTILSFLWVTTPISASAFILIGTLTVYGLLVDLHEIMTADRFLSG